MAQRRLCGGKTRSGESGGSMKRPVSRRRLLLAAAVVLLLVSIPAFAALSTQVGPKFLIRSAAQQVQPGEEVRVELVASPGRTTAGAFRFSLTYDAAAFSYVRKEDASQIQGADLFVRQSNPLVSVYTCDTQQGGAALLSGEVAAYVFRVREDAEPGTYTFSAKTDEVCDYDGNPLADSDAAAVQMQVSFSQTQSEISGLLSSAQSVSSAAAGQPYLTTLLPEDTSLGQLQPAFRPEVTSYRMTVPESCAELWFQTGQPDGVAVTVNRHTLQAAGNDTVITVTAKALSDGGQRIYTIVVHREHSGESTVSTSAVSAPQAEAVTIAAPAGTGLTPSFQPDIHDYEMTVPASCSEVYLQADTDTHAAVTANRHTLLAAGNDTVITLTVTAADGSGKTQYRFVVHRLAEPQSTSSAAARRAAGQVKTSGKSAAKKASRAAAASKTKKAASAGRKSSASRTGTAKSAKTAARGEEAYTPSAVPVAAAQQGGLTVAGNDGFTGFQTGILVLFLAASAAVAGILGTRAYCRKKTAPETAGSTASEASEVPEEKP